MIQCFVKQNYEPVFKKDTQPRLLYASKIDSNYTIHPRVLHNHEEELEVLYVRSGTGIYIIEDTRYGIKAGDLIICNRGVLHDEDPSHSQDLNTYCLAFTDVFIKGLPDNYLIEKDECPLIPCKELFESIENIMGTIYSLLASGTKGIEETCSNLAGAFLALVFQIIQKNKSEEETGKQGNSDMLSRRIKQYIDIHYDEDITLESIGKALHMNPYYVSHVFKDNTGYSPIQYTMRRRIGEAQSMLINTDYPITLIASLVGYNNPSHFNAMFAKYINMSPSKYRKNYTNKEKK